MAHLNLTFLGPFQAYLDGQLCTEFESDKVRALLAYLAVGQKRPYERATLAALFWPDMGERAARRNLTQTLSRLRKALNDRQSSNPFFVASYQAIQFNSVSEHALDVAAFTQSILDGSIEDLKTAVGYYQGEFLMGLNLPDSPAFEEWLLFKRETYQQMTLESLHKLANLYLESGDYAQTETYARRQLELDGWLESAHRQLMLAFARNGRRSAAITQYEKLCDILEAELGVEPEDETIALYKSIRDGHVEEGAQVQGTLQPPAFISKPSSPASNLPHPFIPLLGRDKELAWIQSSLDNGCRLMTLVGEGGSGKSHLALHAAYEILDLNRYEVYFVSLSAISSARQLVGAIAQSLDLQLSNQKSAESQLFDYLRFRPTLLILDNYEHLVDHVGLIERILQNTPEVIVLITSQVRLNLHGEWVLRLGGLEYPSTSPVDMLLEKRGKVSAKIQNGKPVMTGNLEQYSAIQLFRRSAQRVSSDFRLDSETGPSVVRICKLVGGLPLGIELAAAWARLYPCETIAGEIEKNLDFLTSTYRNLPERHRSMRAAFEYAWRLLRPQEQTALRRLSIFASSFERKAAAQIVSVGLPEMLSLVDKSLLQHIELDRYQWHTLLHHYANEKLAEDPQERTNIEQTHSHYYLEFLRERAFQIEGQAQKHVLQEIEQEIQDIQNGWYWACRYNDFIDAHDAIRTLYHFFQIKGRLEEMLELCEKSILLLDNYMLEDEDARIGIDYWRILAYQGGALVQLARFEEAQGVLETALLWLDADEDPHTMGLCLSNLGILSTRLGDFEKAHKRYQQGLTIYRTLGEQNAQARALNSLGVISNDLGDFEQAKEYLDESIALHRLTGNRAYEVYALSNRGATAYNQQEYEEARAYHTEALAVARDAEFRNGIMLCLLNLADVACEQENYHTTRRLAMDGIRVAHELKDARQAAWGVADFGRAETCLGNYASAYEYFCRGIATALAIQAIPRALENLVGLAKLWAHMGWLEHAIEVLGVCLRHPSLQRKVHDRADHLLGELKQELALEVIKRGLKAGHEHTLEQTIHHILSEYNRTAPVPILVGKDTVWKVLL